MYKYSGNITKITIKWKKFIYSLFLDVKIVTLNPDKEIMTAVCI